MAAKWKITADFGITHISFIFFSFDSKPGSCRPICDIIIANKSCSSAKETLVCSFRAGGTNHRHLGWCDVMRSSVRSAKQRNYLKRDLWERYRDILGWSFYGGNTVKNRQSWCSALICRKRSAFEMQFRLIVVSICLITYVKDHGDSSSRLLERRIWLVRIGALLLAVM